MGELWFIAGLYYHTDHLMHKGSGSVSWGWSS